MTLTRMYVHPNFLKKMKIKAAIEGKSLYKLTKKLAEDDLIECEGWKYQKKPNKFKFEF